MTDENIAARRRLSALGLAILVPFAAHTAQARPPSLAVAVDVGHTIDAPGAISARGRTELDFNRELAEHLISALQERGIAVLPINTDGRIASLQARAEAAIAAGVDFFISLHHDSVGEHELLPWTWNGQSLTYSDRFAGHSLFVSRDNPDTARSVLCARTMGARLQTMGFAPTHKNGRRRAYADFTHAVHFYDNLAVLRHTTMPAVLFEAGVIKNREEEALLAAPRRQARMADALATGIAACLIAGEPADDEATADGADRSGAW